MLTKCSQAWKLPLPAPERPFHPLPPRFILLLCRPDRVGDVIIATACLEPIRQQRPDERIVFLAREVMRPLLDGHPLLDGFIGLPPVGPDGNPSRAAREALTAQIRARQAKAIVHLHPDEPCQRAARDAGVPRRIGYRRSLFPDLTMTDRFPDRRADGRRHEAEHNFDLLAPLGVTPPAPETLRPSVHLPESWLVSLRIRLAAAGFERFDDGDEPYAVVNPTAFAADLRWPPDAFAWLALELLKPGRFARVILVADHVNDPSMREIRRLNGPGVPGLIDLSGETNLAELGWLLRHARLLVSRNTGTTHLAAAVGCPTVELFGRMEPIYGPGRWRALGERVSAISAAPGKRRLGESKRAFWQRGYASIPREAVLEAALNLVDTRPEAQADADT